MSTTEMYVLFSQVDFFFLTCRICRQNDRESVSQRKRRALLLDEMLMYAVSSFRHLIFYSTCRLTSQPAEDSWIQRRHAISCSATRDFVMIQKWHELCGLSRSVCLSIGDETEQSSQVDDRNLGLSEWDIHWLIKATKLGIMYSQIYQ